MPQLSRKPSGVYVIAATPFTETGALDLESVPRMVDWYLEKGVSGMTILGIMGEAPKLTHDEAIAFSQAVLGHVDGRIPVVVGATSPGYATTRLIARTVADAGAAGVMIAPPGTLKGDAAVMAYCRQVQHELGEIAWVLQDYPQSGSPFMSPALIRAIVRECPSCVILKHEDWPGLDKITELRAQEAAGAERIGILVGTNGLFMPDEILRGADGAMTGYSYPDMLVEMLRRMQAGEVDGALDLFDLHLPYLRYEQQPGVGLVVRKYVLAKRGAIACPAARAPAPSLTPETVADIERLLARMERGLASHGA